MNTVYISIILIMFLPAAGILAYFLKMFKEISTGISIMTLILSLYVFSAHSDTYSYFYLNNINRYLLISIASIYFLATVYGTGYHRKMGASRNLKLHTSLINFFASTMFFSVLVNNLALMWIGIEGTTAASALLIVIEGEGADIEAAWRYIIVVSSGLSIALISIIIIYRFYGTLEITSLLSGQFPSSPLNSPVIPMAALLGIVGFGTKAGLFPMHSWLPDAHGRAPSEVSAIFSSALLPVAVYAIYIVLQPTMSGVVRELTIYFAMVTILFVALVMASQRDIKRMYAYSTMENMSLILLGLVLGGPALIGAILIILTHAFGKAGAFFSSGNILEMYGTRNIKSIHDLHSRSKLTFYTLSLSSFSVTGAPPFGTFIGELLILSEMFSQGFGFAAFILIILLSIIFLSLNYKVFLMAYSPGKGEGVDSISPQQIGITVFSVSMAFVFGFLYLGGVL